MELLVILLFGLWVRRRTATVRAVLTDGRGHTPDVRSTDRGRREPSQRTLRIARAWYVAGSQAQ